jgi:hypothetical protein
MTANPTLAQAARRAAEKVLSLDALPAETSLLDPRVQAAVLALTVLADELEKVIPLAIPPTDPLQSS